MALATHGNIVDGFDHAICSRELATQDLDGKRRVRESAAFVRSGVSGSNEGNGERAPRRSRETGTELDGVYSGSVSPEPPNSDGKSLYFGSPSRTGRTFSA